MKLAGCVRHGRHEGAKRARAGEHVLSHGERVGGRAEQGARRCGVRAGGGGQDIVEEQERDQENGGGGQGHRQAAHEHPDRAGPVRAVREIAELQALGVQAVGESLRDGPVSERTRDAGQQRQPDADHRHIEGEQRDPEPDDVGDVTPGRRIPPAGPDLGQDAGPGH
jgi:hypothetical protein